MDHAPAGTTSILQMIEARLAGNLPIDGGHSTSAPAGFTDHPGDSRLIRNPSTGESTPEVST